MKFIEKGKIVVKPVRAKDERLLYVWRTPVLQYGGFDRDFLRSENFKSLKSANFKNYLIDIKKCFILINTKELNQMSDEAIQLLKALMSAQELTNAKIDGSRKEMSKFRNENSDRLDNIDAQLIGIKRDIRSMGTDLDKTINR
jgi:hypothetical protein